MYNFKPVTDRISRMRERYRDTVFTLDAERALIVTDFCRQNMQMPAPVKRARILYEVCSKMTVRVEDDEIIVGNLATNYKGTTLWPEHAGLHWLYQELDDGSFYTRTAQEEPMIIPEAEKEKLMTIREFWTENLMWKGMRSSMPDGIEGIADTNVFLIAASDLGRVIPTGHLLPNYAKVINKGFAAVRNEAKQKIAAITAGIEPCTDGDKYFFYQSVITVCDAFMLLAHRYADTCRETAKATQDVTRKEELLKMADSLDRIAEHPAQSFHEAVQAVYLYQVFLFMDGIYQAPSLGRFDQYTYPFLKADLAAGVISMDEAQEIVDCFWIKIGCLFGARIRVATLVAGAFSTFQHITIGGCDQEGSDATNPVTFMCLEAPARLLLHEPPVSLRMSKNTPDELFACAIESSRLAGGIPCFHNEDLIIESLVEGKYYSLEDARNFAVIGCQEYGGSGNDYAASGAVNSLGDINLGNVLIQSLNNGINPLNQKQCGLQNGYLFEMESFAQVQEAVQKGFDYFTNWLCTANSCMEFFHMREFPVPALSALMDGCMESGIDCVSGGAKYNSYGIGITGVATLIDSLVAIKYVIYDAKICTVREFYDAWMANWEGYENIRQQIKAMPHHYGNNDPYADEIAGWAMNMVGESINNKHMKRGRWRAGAITASFHVFEGMLTWATPDGRKFGESLSDATSPIQGMDTNGPTAVMASVCSFNHKLYSNGLALNLRFSPSSLAGEDAITKIRDMLLTYFDMGGMEVQYNIVSSETLRNAQTDPDAYKNLIVRVAGFSAYFVELSTPIQNDIIARTENVL